jgi:hypothetical protein
MSAVHDIFGKSFDEVFPNQLPSAELKKWSKAAVFKLDESSYISHIIFEDEPSIIYCYSALPVKVSILVTDTKLSYSFMYKNKEAYGEVVGNKIVYLFRD